MKMTTLFIVVAFSTSFVLTEFAEAKGEMISKADVPVAVQQAADTAAKGGKIVRWEKEGKRYEAVVKKDGKATGLVFDEKGKLLSRRDESKEKRQ